MATPMGLKNWKWTLSAVVILLAIWLVLSRFAEMTSGAWPMWIISFTAIVIL
ncbi:uncharacterized protein FIESC28_00777 [Fusarium coffeatum]|uniref:Uncharacterized protein n=1 Tax=Fusarium coffeatum TaxID=231269 RepID=A0A366SAX3_9HYPO|nr:uncharacterized protein FIESC28_00777 [Fusarium coffeatum]RBR26483.1 hypothetical protein FIESC28_00777 [Fusarium coffeatum]